MKVTDRILLRELFLEYNNIMATMPTQARDANLLAIVEKFEKFYDDIINRELTALIRPFTTIEQPRKETWQERLQRHKKDNDAKKN